MALIFEEESEKKLEYKILTAPRADLLQGLVTKMINEGWRCQGSHTCVTKVSLYRYRGNQLADIQHELEYAQTIYRYI